ncbi:hypothetical protein LCGC14_1529560 [marine sediment metagenome]|uniref:TNase-like domain-containing protein n=1 Tax=marine sediment metagenome TaxID=412755 RepID=A0A0F9LBW8_9ZZZZ
MNNRSRRLILIILTTCLIGISLTFFSVQVNAWEIDRTGNVYYIYDGDTLNATSVGIIRLADIDTPESNESGYIAAKNYLSSLVNNELIYIDVDDVYGTDIYGRTVAIIYVRYDNERLLNVNLALLNGGYAVLEDHPNEFNPNDWTLYVNYPIKPDLTDRGSDYSDFTPDQVSPGNSSITITCDIANIGNYSSSTFYVYFYASNDSIITPSDYYIGYSGVSTIDINNFSDCSYAGVFPVNIPDGEYYIGFIIDPSDSSEEWNENNNEGYITFRQLLVDGTPPLSSISFPTLNGSNRIDKSTLISFTSSDNGGSGGSSIFYSIDGGEWKEFTGNFTLVNYNKGTHIISYYSVDILDNAEEIKSITVIKTDLSSTEIFHSVSIIIAVSLGIIVIIGMSIILLYWNKKRKDDRMDSLKEDSQREKEKIDNDITYHKDPVVNFIISDLLLQYSEIIIAIYGIGSYFDDELPSNWTKNDLDVIVFVKSLEIIPKQQWTEIRYRKKVVEGIQIWIGLIPLKRIKIKLYLVKNLYRITSGA